MRLAAIVAIIALAAGSAAHGQSATVQPDPRQHQTRILVTGWPPGTFACAVSWREGVEPKTDVRRVPGDAARYEIDAAQGAVVNSFSCTPDTPPGVTQTPDGCRELLRPAYGAVASAGAAKEFRDANPGQSIIFRIALTPNAEGAPQNIAVVAQTSSNPQDVVDWGGRIGPEIAAIAEQSRFTSECAGARIMLPFTLR